MKNKLLLTSLTLTNITLLVHELASTRFLQLVKTSKPTSGPLCLLLPLPEMLFLSSYMAASFHQVNHSFLREETVGDRSYISHDLIQNKSIYKC